MKTLLFATALLMSHAVLAKTIKHEFQCTDKKGLKHELQITDSKTTLKLLGGQKVKFNEEKTEIENPILYTDDEFGNIYGEGKFITQEEFRRKGFGVFKGTSFISTIYFQDQIAKGENGRVIYTYEVTNHSIAGAVLGYGGTTVDVYQMDCVKIAK